MAGLTATCEEESNKLFDCHESGQDVINASFANAIVALKYGSELANLAQLLIELLKAPGYILPCLGGRLGCLYVI